MSNSVVTLSSFNVLFFTQVLTVLSSTIKYTEYVTDKGKNISIPCTADSSNIMWVKENGNYSTIVQNGKYLVLTNVTTSDEGVYVCFAAITSRITIHTNETRQLRNHNNVDDDNNNNDDDDDDVITLNKKNDKKGNSKTISREIPLINSSLSSSYSTLNIDDYKGSNISSRKNLTHEISDKSPTKYASTTSILPKSLINVTTTNDGIAFFEEKTTAITPTILNIGNSYRSNNTNNNQNNIKYNLYHPTNISMASTTSTPKNIIEQKYLAIEKIYIKVRTTPGPVTQLYFKASTILGFLIWRFNQSNSGGYTVRSFTAEYRNVSYKEVPFNSSFEHEWIRMDPINIAPNVRQMEVYHLEPNTTYEFRIWANNQLGSGEVVTTNVTTLPETKEEDLIRLIQPDLDNFDPRIWIIAVSIVLGTLVILGIGLCVILSRECYQSSRQEFEDGWDGIELIPNIILNPGFHETDSDSNEMIPNLRTIIFRSNDNNNNIGITDGDDDDDDDSYDSESDHEPRIEKFKRKLSVFFTDPTIRRI